MPKHQNTIQFSLTTEQREKLISIAKSGESLGLTAKRLVLNAIDDGSTAPVPADNQTDSLFRETVEGRLVELEKQNQDLRTEIDGLRRLFYQFSSPVKKR